MSAKLMKSNFVRLSSVRVAIISEPNARISFKFWLLLPLSHTPGRFFIFFFIFVNMGPYRSQDFKTPLLLQIAVGSFQTFFWIFFPNGPHKTTFGILVILKIEILTNFCSFSLTWNPKGVKISERYFSYKSQPKAFKLLLNFYPNGPHKITFGIFEILIFFVSLNMGTSGSQNFKTLLLPQISFESFQTFSEFSSQWSS